MSVSRRDGNGPKQEPTTTVLGDIGLSIQTSVASTRPETIHSCDFCAVQEIDPDLKSRGDDSAVCVIKYRGSRVLDGALKGCAFFQELITHLEPILKANGYEDKMTSARKFRLNNWVSKLCFYEFCGTLQTAIVEWNCVKGGITRMNSGFDMSRAVYCLMAYHGMHKDHHL